MLNVVLWALGLFAAGLLAGWAYHWVGETPANEKDQSEKALGIVPAPVEPAPLTTLDQTLSAGTTVSGAPIVVPTLTPPDSP